MENDQEKTSFISTGKVVTIGINILGQKTFSNLEKSEIFLPIVFNFLINFFQKRGQKNASSAEQ